MVTTNFSEAAHFKKFSITLQKIIQDATGVMVSVDDMHKALVERFGSTDFELGYALAGLIPPKDWHLVILGDASKEIIARHDSITAATSRIEALSFALFEMNLALVVPDEVIADERIIEFRLNGKLILRIEPTPFMPINLVARHRVMKALKGVRQYHAPRMQTAMKSIPGLGYDAENESTNVHKIHGECLIKSSANLALVIREVIRACELELKQHQAQEITAQVFGAKNWATFIAKEDERGNIQEPMIIADKEVFENPALLIGTAKIYRTVAEALWEFGQMIKNAPEQLTFDVKYSLINIYGETWLAGHNPSKEPECSRFFVSGLSPAFGGENEDMKQAIELLASANLENALAAYLDITTRSQDKIITSVMKRRGVSSTNWRQIGKIIFSIENADDYHGKYLLAETLDASGKKTSAKASKIYKAEIAVCVSTGNYAVIGDYTSRVDIQLDGLNHEQVEELSAFSGIEILKRPFDDVKTRFGQSR